MTRVRVVERDDGGVSIIRAIEVSYPNRPPDDEYYPPIFERAMQNDPVLVGRPWHDMDDAHLPSRVLPCDDPACTNDKHPVRNEWRVKDGKVYVDGSVTNPFHLAGRLDHILEQELSASAPDPVKLARIDRARRDATEAMAGDIPVDAAKETFDQVDPA